MRPGLETRSARVHVEAALRRHGAGIERRDGVWDVTASGEETCVASRILPECQDELSAMGCRVDRVEVRPDLFRVSFPTPSTSATSRRCALGSLAAFAAMIVASLVVPAAIATWRATVG